MNNSTNKQKHNLYKILLICIFAIGCIALIPSLFVLSQSVLACQVIEGNVTGNFLIMFRNDVANLYIAPIMSSLIASSIASLISFLVALISLILFILIVFKDRHN